MVSASLVKGDQQQQIFSCDNFDRKTITSAYESESCLFFVCLFARLWFFLFVLLWFFCLFLVFFLFVRLCFLVFYKLFQFVLVC